MNIMRTFRAFGKMLFLLVGTIFILTLEAQSQVVISGPTTACVGQTYTYTATPNYGIYTWTVNGGTFLPTTTNSIQVTWTTSGTHLIGVRWTLFGGGAAALVVRVYDLPVPTITGNIVVCISTGVPAYELYTTEAGMTAYIWSVSAGGTITTGAGTRTIGVTWNTAGTYNVCINYTDANGCAAKTPTCVTVKVIQVPTPTIAGPSIACVGSTGNVYTTQAGNANYIWTVTAGGQQTAGGNSNTMTVTWNTPGTQKVSVSYVEPICGDIEGPVFFTVTVKQNLPVSVSISASPSGTVNAGTSVTFTAIPTNGGSNPSYQWKVNGINVGSGGSTFTSSLLKNGDVVTVVMTSSEMCTSGNPATSNSITMSVLTQTACCPNFNLVDADTICENPDSSCKLTGNNFLTSDKSIIACKNSYHKYTVYPVLTGYSYTWTITGGTPATFTGNSCIILWGSGDPNYIKVVIRNGTCIDSIFRKVCLVDGPNASFTFSPITDCNAPVHFINTSTGGIGYTWDFGDGTTSDLFNPPDHSYANPGTYTVSLTVFSEGIIKFSDSNSMPCGCVDSIMKKVTVPALKNPPIVTPVCCFGTLCPGDTSSSCTTAAGCIYTWSVTGGNIISGAGTACIKVVWGLSYTIPTTVNLSVSGCPGYCTGTTTLHVPVLYSGLPITGPTIVCENSASSFSLPTMPGTFYTWTVTGGAKFNGADRHTPNVSITFPAYPMNCMITCVYNNPLAGCSGSSVLQVAVKTEFKIVWGSDIVCVGDISTYNANGPATWSVTPAGPTINGSGYGTSVTWNTPGSYTLIATPTPGTFCNLNSTMNVTVLADPILGPIIGPVPGIICPGAVTTYSISSNTPGQPFYWIVSGGKPVSTMGAYSDSVIVQWNSAGPYKISVYQEIQPYGCKSLQQSLTVNSYPKPVFTGPSTACVDVPVTYTETAASMPDGSYQWTITPSPSCQGTITSGQGTSSINVIWHGKIGPPGPWTGQINVKTCTGTTSRSVIVKDIPIAVASFIGIPIYCQGENKTFTIQTPYDVLYSYAWFQEFNGNTTSAGTQNSIPIAIQNLTAPGTYRFYVVVTKNGCSYRSNYVDVIILSCTNGLPDIIVPPGPGCSTEAFFIPYIECNRIKFLNFSTPLSSDITYLWTVSALSGGGSGSFDFPNASTPTLTVTKSGNYSIILTVTTI
jgi:PKD repeat protein